MTAVIPEAVEYPAYNLRNLTEVPVLFYATCLGLFALDRVDAAHLGLAWAFVGFRVLHSLVHCTMNNVMTRFTLYVLSSIALWAMVVRFAWSVL
ncbi:MAG: MAPEG family protein [Polyangiaceae bacterium]|nr:MAPEG family protein [Polyangiaceae bacterium]